MDDITKKSLRSIIRKVPDKNGNFIMLFPSPKNSGKTIIIINLLQYLWLEEFGADNIFLFYPNKESNDNQYNQLPLIRENIIDEYDPDILTGLINRQHELTKKGESNKILVILDDCAGLGSFSKNIGYNPISDIAMNRRHDKISMVLTSQYVMKFTPILRKNADYVYIFPVIGEDLDFISSTFYYDSKKNFKKLLLTVNKDFGWLLLDIKKKSIWRYDNDEKKISLIMHNLKYIDGMEH